MMSDCNNVRIAYVTDLNINAPAMKLAHQLKINKFTDLKVALTHHVDFIIEATGVKKVQEMILQNKSEGSEMISSNAALFFFSVFRESKKKSNNATVTNIKNIKNEINTSLDNIDVALRQIKRTSKDLNMLALNARIEAAHAGVHGSGFAVVADEVNKSALIMHEMAGKIEDINYDISDISTEIEGYLSALV